MPYSYDKGLEALYQGYYDSDILENVSKMLNSLVVGTAQIRDLAVTNAKIKNITTDKLEAGTIKISPNLLDDDYVNDIYTRFEVTDGKIESEISAVTEDLGEVSSSVTQLAGQISSKVEYTDFTGENIVSLIEQTPSYITLSAEKIYFDGHVFGEGATFSGNIATAQSITVGNQIYLGNQNVFQSKGIRWTNNDYITSASVLGLSVIHIRSSTGVALTGSKVQINGDLDLRGSHNITATAKFA